MTSNVTTTTGTPAAPSSGSIAAPSSGWTDVTLFSSSYGKLQFDNLIASRDSTSLSLLTRSKESTKTKVARCRGSVPCGTCATFIVMGYTNTLCSLAGRPHTTCATRPRGTSNDERGRPHQESHTLGPSRR